MTAPLRDQVAEINRAHRLDFPRSGEWRCLADDCEWAVPDELPNVSGATDAHAAHLADVITTLVEQRERHCPRCSRAIMDSGVCSYCDDYALLVARVKALADSPWISTDFIDSLSRADAERALLALLSDADTSALEQREREVRAEALARLDRVGGTDDHLIALVNCVAAGMSPEDLVEAAVNHAADRARAERGGA